MGFKNQVLDWNPNSRTATLLHKEDGRLSVESSQDVSTLIEWTKARAQGVVDDPEYKFVGAIPEATLNQAFAEGWFHDRKAWERWLANNPKFSAKWHK